MFFSIRLYDAARSARLQEVKKLLEQDNVDINSIDFNSGNTALHAAAQSMCRHDCYFFQEMKKGLIYSSQLDQLSNIWLKKEPTAT